MLSEDGFEPAHSTWCIDVTDNTDHDQGRGLYDCYGFYHFLLVRLCNINDKFTVTIEIEPTVYVSLPALPGKLVLHNTNVSVLTAQKWVWVKNKCWD